MQAHLDLSWIRFSQNYIYINSTVLIFESFISLLCVVQDFCKNVNFPISTEMNLCFIEFLNKGLQMCCRLIQGVADGAEESTSRRGERTSWLGEKSCLVCVTKAKAFQEF